MTISRVGAVTELADTAILPAHAVGDLIMVFAYRAGARYPRPSLPVGFTNLHEGWSGLNCSRIGYKIATTASESIGVWGGASAVVAVVYRCTGRWKGPLIAVTGNAFAAYIIRYPELAARPGMFVRFAGQRTATNMLDVTPTGWTAVTGAATRVRALEAASEGAASKVGANTQQVNTSSSYRAVTVNLAETIPPDVDEPIREVWDKIPAEATVFTLSGLSFNLYNDMPQKFRGLFSQAPYVMKQIKYPASLAPKSITEGVRMLDEALAETSGDIIVLAQSQGAQVCTRWMDTYAGDTTREALASRVVFVLTGNPLRSTGNGAAIGVAEVDGLLGEPTRTDTVWPIVDVARRWDGWAEQPDDLENKAATKNAELGKTLLHRGYGEVELFDTTHSVWTVGNTTYVLTQEAVPPLLANTDFEGEDDDTIKELIARVRQVVESAYDRSYEPAPTSVPEPNDYWDALLTKLGVAPTEMEEV